MNFDLSRQKWEFVGKERWTDEEYWDLPITKYSCYRIKWDEKEDKYTLYLLGGVIRENKIDVFDSLESAKDAGYEHRENRIIEQIKTEINRMMAISRTLDMGVTIKIDAIVNFKE